jgi:hypothetical protein
MKAPRKSLSLWNLVLMIPLFLFVVLSFLSWKRGQEGIWHQRLVEFWQKNQWTEIMAMSANLLRAGKTDSETLYFAMLASVQNQDLESARKFGEELINQRVLNPKIEKSIREIVMPDSILSVIQLRRTDVTMAIFLILTAGSIILIKKEGTLPWLSIASMVGIAILRI